MRIRRGWTVAVAGLAALTGASELAQWAASATPQPPSGDCAVLVLGYPSASDGSPTPLQKARVDAGVQAVRKHRCDLIVFTGGAAHNAHRESDAMAALAAPSLAGSPVRIARESAARNTWENVRYSLPLLQGHARIFIASEGLHARRARRYLCRQLPAMCESTFVAASARPWRMLPYRLVSSLYELQAWIRDSSASGG